MPVIAGIPDIVIPETCMPGMPGMPRMPGTGGTAGRVMPGMLGIAAIRGMVDMPGTAFILTPPAVGTPRTELVMAEPAPALAGTPDGTVALATVFIVLSCIPTNVEGAVCDGWDAMCRQGRGYRRWRRRRIRFTQDSLCLWLLESQSIYSTSSPYRLIEQSYVSPYGLNDLSLY